MSTQSIRTEIGKIFVKWGLPTRQVAISEIVTLVRDIIGPMEDVYDEKSKWIEGAIVARNALRRELLDKLGGEKHEN